MLQKTVVYTVKVTEEQFNSLKAIEKSLGVRREILIPALAQTVIKNYQTVLPLVSAEISQVTLSNIQGIAENGGIVLEAEKPKATPKTPEKTPDKKSVSDAK